MRTYRYDAVTNAFYPYELQQDYEAAGNWPVSGVDVDETIFQEFIYPPSGKMRSPDKDGNPSWKDIPAPTHKQLVDALESQRKLLLAEADVITADWRTELALNIIYDDDKAKLTAWMKYIKAVKAVDTSTAPDVSWPEKPAE